MVVCACVVNVLHDGGARGGDGPEATLAGRHPLGTSRFTRLATFLTFLFFLSLTLRITYPTDARGAHDRKVAKRVLSFGSGLGAMACLVLMYNYARYHTISTGDMATAV